MVTKLIKIWKIHIGKKLKSVTYFVFFNIQYMQKLLEHVLVIKYNHKVEVCKSSMFARTLCVLGRCPSSLQENKYPSFIFYIIDIFISITTYWILLLKKKFIFFFAFKSFIKIVSCCVAFWNMNRLPLHPVWKILPLIAKTLVHSLTVD